MVDYQVSGFLGDGRLFYLGFGVDNGIVVLRYGIIMDVVNHIWFGLHCKLQFIFNYGTDIRGSTYGSSYLRDRVVLISASSRKRICCRVCLLMWYKGNST